MVRLFYVKDLRALVTTVTANCTVCTLTKHSAPNAPRGTIWKGQFFGDIFAADHITLPPTLMDGQPYRHLLVVVDTFSKYVSAHPTKTTSTHEVIQAMRSILDHPHPQNPHDRQRIMLYVQRIPGLHADVPHPS